MGMADILFVNSKYTESVFRQTFPSLSHKKLTVLYPSLNTKFFDEEEIKQNSEFVPLNSESIKHRKALQNSSCIFLSINRFEVKKNVDLAVRAFARLRDVASSEKFLKCTLVLAGGYDTHNKENHEYYEHLQKLVDELELTNFVLFIPSPDDSTKIWLYLKSNIVIYTPDKEHFGIVPLEAMYLGRPVIAVNSGGPTETIINNETGFLISNSASAFAEVMLKTINNLEELDEIGRRAKLHVHNNYSFESFTEKLDRMILKHCKNH